ncbi:MAG: hypothetical protein HWQ38_18780 [Nostoc sp. NMS7]|uniref:hypothetical protein n=1 Tax=Nostoc sp. NMS7 TaxID=2815391 RepID=UPI0025F89C6F|nr:hypothetical protein [Nostoc sp. NMS7]MBN3948381.1 hypothetical protein [Nostoc sp. NMS7]
MKNIKLCGNVHNSGDECSGKKGDSRKLRRRQKKCGSLPDSEGERSLRFLSKRVRAESQPTSGTDWERNNPLGQPSQGASGAGKIAAHLIDDCRNRIKRNNHQIARNERNIKFLKEQIVHLEQEQVDLASENEQLLTEILDLQEIQNQMVDPE